MDNYPPGAAHDTRAPYNEMQANPIERTVRVGVTLESDLVLNTVDYTCGVESDDMGAHGWTDIDADWASEYDVQCASLPDLLSELRKYIEAELATHPKWVRRERLKYMLRSARGWQVVEVNTEML